MLPGRTVRKLAIGEHKMVPLFFIVAEKSARLSPTWKIENEPNELWI